MCIISGVIRAGRSNYILAADGRPYYYEQQVCHICCIPLLPSHYYLMTPGWKNGKEAGSCDLVAWLCSCPPLCCLQRMFGCITPADEYHEKLFRRLTGKRVARQQKAKAASPSVEGVTTNPLQVDAVETGSAKEVSESI